MSVSDEMSAVRSTTKGVEPVLFGIFEGVLVAGIGFEPMTFGL
jgi:hypothetical protein